MLTWWSWWGRSFQPVDHVLELSSNGFVLVEITDPVAVELMVRVQGVGAVIADRSCLWNDGESADVDFASFCNGSSADGAVGQ